MTEGEVCPDETKPAPIGPPQAVGPPESVPFAQASGSWFPDPACSAIIGLDSRSHPGNVGEDVGARWGWTRGTEGDPRRGGAGAPVEKPRWPSADRPSRPGRIPCRENPAKRILWDSFVGDDPLDTETELKGVPVVMSEDFQQKHIGTVAGIIGIIVLLLGLGGILFNL